MRKWRKDEKAVSPVIATILMVAITIVLAAVIASFVYGYTGSLETTKDVTATASFIAKGGTKTIIVTYHGGPDQDDVSSLTVYATTAGGTAITSGTSLSTTVGSSVTLTSNVANKGQNHVVVKATFNDGTEQVILDTWV
jgi:flagellin-like protein